MSVGLVFIIENILLLCATNDNEMCIFIIEIDGMHFFNA